MANEPIPPSRSLVPVKRIGRPTLYSEDVADEIVERMSCGETLVAICKKERNGRLRIRGEFPAFGTVMDWTDPNEKSHRPDFMLRFARARLRQQEYWMEEAIEIANTPEPGYEEVAEHSAIHGVSIRRARKDMLQHRALKIDTRFKVAARINPQKWAERLQYAPSPADDPNREIPRIVIEGGLPDDNPNEPGKPSQEP